MKSSFLFNEVDTRVLSPIGWICCCILFSGVFSIPFGAMLYQVSQHVPFYWINAEPMSFISGIVIQEAGAVLGCAIAYLIIFRRLPSSMDKIIWVSRRMFLAIVLSILAGTLITSVVGVIADFIAVNKPVSDFLWRLPLSLRFVIFGSENGTYLGVIICIIDFIILRRKNHELTQ